MPRLAHPAVLGELVSVVIAASEVWAEQGSATVGVQGIDGSSVFEHNVSGYFGGTAYALKPQPQPTRAAPATARARA